MKRPVIVQYLVQYVVNSVPFRAPALAAWGAVGLLTTGAQAGVVLAQEAVPTQAPASASAAVPAPAQLVNPAPVLPPPNPEIAALLQQVSKVAQEVEAKTEQVKALEDELARQQEAVERADQHVRDTQEQLRQAEAALVRQQLNVDNIAQSRYRGEYLSTLTTTLAAGSPQDAVDRLGYMGALSRDSRRNLSLITETARQVRGAKDTAEAAAQSAQEQKRAVEEHKATVEKERGALERSQREIADRVNALNEEQRRAWESQFAPAAKIDAKALEALKLTGVGGEAVKAALTRQGSPYDWGATGPERFDCSGLMVWAYQQQGKVIPRTSQAQIAGGTPVPLDQLQPGDLVGYYPGLTHVGMYIGNGQVVHASTYGVPVQVVPMHSMPVVAAVRY